MKTLSHRKIKREKDKIIMSWLDDYFRLMEETSRSVDPMILDCFQKNKTETHNNDLYEKLHDAAMGRLGKPKMRSFIARLGYEICGGKDLSGFLPIATAMDLLEFSYYCCDKIFDSPAIFKNHQDVEDKIIISHILVSYVFSLIGESADRLNLNNKQSRSILAAISVFIEDIYKGFFIENHNDKPSMDVYEKRTYFYNYWEHILKIGGLAAGANSEEIEALSDFGKNIGIAYMVTNDISDITKNFEDIKNGRHTITNILFLERANENEKELFKKLFGNQDAEEDELKSLAKIMVDNGIIKEAQIYASGFIEKALPCLKTFNNSLAKKMLAVATRTVYKNQWYRSMNELYGYKREVLPCDLKLSGIDENV